MEIGKSELAAVEQKVEEIEIKQVAELDLALVGGGSGIVLF